MTDDLSQAGSRWRHRTGAVYVCQGVAVDVYGSGQVFAVLVPELGHRTILAPASWLREGHGGGEFTRVEG